MTGGKAAVDMSENFICERILKMGNEELTIQFEIHWLGQIHEEYNF